jgi:hypothetical protein
VGNPHPDQPFRRNRFGGLAKFAASSPKLGGDDIVAEHVKIYLGIATAGGVAAMFTTLAFFLIAVLLTLGVIVDSLWGRFQRR